MEKTEKLLPSEQKETEDNHKMEPVEVLLRSAMEELIKVNPKSPVIAKIEAYSGSLPEVAPFEDFFSGEKDKGHTLSSIDFENLMKVISHFEEELRKAKIENSELREKVNLYDGMQDYLAAKTKEEYELKLIELQHEFLVIDRDYQEKSVQMKRMEEKLDHMGELLQEKDKELRSME